MNSIHIENGSLSSEEENNTENENISLKQKNKKI